MLNSYIKVQHKSCQSKIIYFFTFVVVRSGAGAGVALFWDVHGEAAEGKHPADHPAHQLCAEDVHF